MHSLVDARIERFLIQRLHCPWHDIGTVLERMRTLARVGGFDLDSRFAGAGLAAGTEARVAASIVNRALGAASVPVPEDVMRQWVARWTRTLRPKGRR